MSDAELAECLRHADMYDLAPLIREAARRLLPAKADEDAAREIAEAATNSRPYWQVVLSRCRREFEERESMKAHPLRNTHINDVPVVAADLYCEAWDRGYKAALAAQRRASDERIAHLEAQQKHYLKYPYVTAPDGTKIYRSYADYCD